nr:MAG TPA: Protein of unknown function (DUF3970) [Caudoviricetes sp.]
MKILIEGEPKEISELLQAVESSKEQTSSTEITITGNKIKQSHDLLHLRLDHTFSYIQNIYQSLIHFRYEFPAQQVLSYRVEMQ